jgi:hypothetical protein
MPERYFSPAPFPVNTSSLITDSQRSTLRHMLGLDYGREHRNYGAFIPGDATALVLSELGLVELGSVRASDTYPYDHWHVTPAGKAAAYEGMVRISKARARYRLWRKLEWDGLSFLTFLTHPDFKEDIARAEADRDWVVDTSLYSHACAGGAA